MANDTTKSKLVLIFKIIFISMFLIWIGTFTTFLILKLINDTFNANVSWFWVWFCLWGPLAICGAIMLVISIIGIFCALRLGSINDEYYR